MKKSLDKQCLLTIPIDEQLKVAIRKVAKKEEMTMSCWCRRIVKQKLIEMGVLNDD